MTAEERAARARAGALWRRYGITVAQYDKMLKRQKGTCALCGKPPKTKRLAVDHDHATKRVRGLLCFLCNKYKVAKNDADSAFRVFMYLDSLFDGRKL